MKKRAFALIFISLILCLGFVLADNSTSLNSSSSNQISNVTTTPITSSGSGVDNVYQCLSNQISKKDSDSISLGEAIFGTLALGSNSKLSDVISKNKNNNADCWPSSNCNIKDTSQVLLAYQRSEGDTSGVESWLMSKNVSARDLSWYLEIDSKSNASSTCTLTYDKNQYKVSIGNDMKLSGNGGRCLSISSSGYWLKINNNCFGKEIQISCDQDFVTSLIYQKTGSNVIFVSSDTQSAPSLGTTSEEVNSQCFSNGNGGCDYEGTLWATLALNKLGVDVSSFIPYISALASDNEQYFPESFLYTVLGGDDNYGVVTQAQRDNKYWEIAGSPYNRYYDSALGLLAIGGTSANEVTNAKNYFTQIEGQDGCWNNDNIRDTAFLLYAGWPRAVSTGGNGGTSEPFCESSGNYCGSSYSCLSQGGQVLNQYLCKGNAQEVCCSVNPAGKTCSAQGGSICSANQQCSTSQVQASDGSCCLGTCQDVTPSASCVGQGEICRTSCLSGESVGSGTCSVSSQLCCVAPTNPQQPSSSSSHIVIWIIILIILILIIIIAILYRHKILVWWYRWRGRASSSPVNRPPRGPPPGFAGQQRPNSNQPMFGRNPMQRPMGRPMQPHHQNPKDKEMEETLRKLREMSK